MADHDLAVTLTFTAGEHASLATEVETLASDISEVTERLNDAEIRVRDSARRLGIDVGADPQLHAVRPEPEAPAIEDWDEVVRRARTAIGEAPTDLDVLLAPREIADIERRFGDGFSARSRIDRYDVIAAVAAGVTAALLDYLIVAVPKQSSLTGALRSLSVDSDNWLSGVAKVPFDRVANVDLSGFAPQAHRVQTFGHDPLLGWVYGTMDILRGSLTGVSKSGVVKVLEVGGAPTGNLAVALGLQAMHLVSDVITPAGLQLPGWTALLTIDHNLLGSRHTVAELSRWMYLSGYDTWHLPTLVAPILATEAVLRGYIGLRQLLDPRYREELDIERLRTGSNRVSDLPRYEVMALIARGVAVAGNAGRFALSGANPLTLNFPLWLAFSKSLLSRLDRARPVDAMADAANLNRLILDAGWVSLRIEADDLPRIALEPRSD